MSKQDAPVVTVLAKASVYVIYTLAVWLLFRGHQEPGGGFVGGLVVGAAIAIQGMVFGLRAAQAVFPLPMHVLLGVGLALAAATTIVPVWMGQPLLTSAFGAVHVPFIGDVEWATAAVFDIGVFFVVVGAVKAILLQIAGDRSRSEAR